MRIKSPFKDYYDHVGYSYGLDDGVVYDRSPLADYYTVDLGNDFVNRNRDVRNLNTMFLFVAGKVFYVKNHDNDWKHISGKLITEEDFEKYKSEYLSYYSPKRTTLEQGKNADSELIKLSKQLQCPVFLLSLNPPGWTNYIVDKTIPILANYGVPAIYPAQQAYQDIEHWITNVLRENPDTSPPVELSDKDRIVQHGFDLKQSFRHRKGD